MDKNKYLRVIQTILGVFIITLSLTGCGSASDDIASGKTYEVDASLVEFYNSLGGEAVLGPAISKLFEDTAGQCQYTVNVLMCVNTSIGEGGGFSLASVGDDLKIKEYVEQPTSSDGLMINGFVVYDEFVPLYDQFSQTTYAGNPITQVQLNYDQLRVEQYFEKVGFYRNFSDPAGTVKLLAYGAESCSKCRYRAAGEARVTYSTRSLDDQSLMDQVTSVPNIDVFGKPLSQVYQAADGNLEQVYTGIVLYKNENGIVLPRPMSTLIGMQTSEPGEKVYTLENGMVFYAVNETLGYHVPLVFDKFIGDHGGVSFSGDPIAEAIQYEPGILRQCFTNYCLDYTPDAPAKKQVTVASIGALYLQQVQTLIASQTTVQTTVQTTGEPLEQLLTEPTPAPSVILQVSEQNKKVSSSGSQVIEVLVLNAADQLPLGGLESELTINLPNNKTWTAVIPATTGDGRSSVAVPPMKNIPNGTILTYQVCLTNLAVESNCATGSYLFWDNP